MRVRLLAAVIAAAAVVLTGLMASSTAWAHARLKESSPKVGEVLAASPTEVRITFTQDVQKISGTYGIEVTGEDGASVTAGPAVLGDESRDLLTVPLQADLGGGRYVVDYKNVSDEDGDPFEGAYAFYVGREPTEAERALDAELAQEDEEETPTASAPTEEAPTPTFAATSTVTPRGNDGGGDSNGALIAVVVVVAALAVAAGVGTLWLRSRAQ